MRSTKPDSLRNRSWRPQRLFGEQARRRRRVRQAIVLLLLVALFLGFLWAVSRPMMHVNTQVLHLTATANPSPADYDAPYARETFQGLQPLSPALYREGDKPGEPAALPALAATQSLTDVAASLRESATSSDALIVVVSANTLVVDGEPSLLCGNFDPSRPQAGAIGVESLLAELKRRRAAVKLLVLDTGYRGMDPRAGQLVDDFLYRLGSVVNQNDDPALWVLCSHSSHEEPFVSPALRRTVFSMFVTEGLRGAADLDLDQTVSVDELHRFVNSHVSAWVRQATDGRLSQTPRLLHCRNSSGEDSATLLSVALIEPEQRQLDLPKLLEAAEQHRGHYPPVRVASSPDASQLTSLPALPRRITDLQQRMTDWFAFLQLHTGADVGDDNAQEDSGDNGEAEAAADRDAEPATDENTDEDVDQRAVAIFKERSALVRQLLVDRDRIASDVHVRQQLLTRTPHLWREFERRLDIAWRALDESDVATADSRFEVLRRVAPTIQAIADGRQPPPARQGLARRFAEAWREDTDRASPPSLAATLNDHPTEELTAFAKSIDAVLFADEAPDWKTLLESVPTAAETMEETRVLRLVASEPALPWQLRRLALQATRLAHQVTTHGRNSSAWMGHLVQRGDMWRKEGFRDLFGVVELRSLDEARDKLLAACESYLEAAEAIEVVHIAQLVNDRCTYDLPKMVSWAYQSLGASPNQAVDPLRLVEMLQLVEKVSTLLNQRDPAKIVELQSAVEMAVEHYQLLRTPLNADSLSYLASTRRGADRVGLDAMLQSNLLSASQQRALLDNRLLMDLEAVESFESPKVGVPTDVEESATYRRWQAYRSMANVVTRLAQFGAGDTVEDENERYQDFAAAVETRASEDQRWQTSAQLERDLQEQFADLPVSIDQRLSDSSADFARIQQARRALMVLDPRDIDRLVAETPAKQIEQQQDYHYFVWQQRVARLRQAFATAPQQSELQSQFRQFVAAATELFPDRRAPRNPRPQIEIVTPPSVEILRMDRPVETFLEIHNQQQQTVYVWVIADHDLAELQFVDSPTPIYSLNSAQVNGRMLKSDSKPTASIGQGETARVRLLLQVLSDTAGATPLRLRIIAANSPRLMDDEDDEASSVDAALLQQSVIPLSEANRYEQRLTWIATPAQPDVELTVEGPDDAVVSEASGYRLLAFPNRATPFRLMISATSPRTKTATVRWVRPAVEPMALPRGAVTASQSRTILNELGDLTVVAPPTDVSLGEVGVPTPFPLPEFTHEPPEDPAAVSPPALPLDRSWVAMIQTPGSDAVLFRRLKVEVQHPRRFLQASARYNLRRKRIELEVRPRSLTKGAAPGGSAEARGIARRSVQPEGPIQLQVTVDPPAILGAASRLQAKMIGGETVRMNLDVEPSPGVVAEVQLAVDDYPRAFTFRVPCDADVEVEPSQQLQTVRIVAPAKYKSFAAPTATVPVHLQVDAPQGAFDNPNHYLEVGVDQDMDRDFQGDQTLRLRADRQLNAFVQAMSPDGQLLIATTVGDIVVDVPSAGLRNQRVNVLAQLRLGNVVSQDVAEEVWMDGLAPRIILQDLVPGRTVTAGEMVEVVVDCIDGEFGFVNKLEAAFDTKGLGEFDAEMPPVEGELMKGNRWKATLPTDMLRPGRQTLLLRATDHVGNASDYTAVRLTIVPEPPPEAKDKGKITGVVRYRGEVAEGATILLESMDAATELETNEATSSEQGLFTFTDVPHGKYQLTVRLLRRNQRLKLVEEAEVTPEKNAALTFSFK